MPNFFRVRGGSMWPVGDGVRGWSIRQKLMVAFIVPVLLILMVTGVVTNWFSARYLNNALGRSTSLITHSLAHEIESRLDQTRDDLLLLAQTGVSPENLTRILKVKHAEMNSFYREVAYISRSGVGSLFFLKTSGGIQEVPAENIGLIRPSPMLMYPEMTKLKQGEVHLSEMAESYYPLPLDKSGHRANYVVMRMATPIFGNDGTMNGYLVLSIDATMIRNLVSLYNSSKSPLHAFPRTPENRYFYMFDSMGWMLFQSETIESGDAPLSTNRVRSGMKGAIGKPGFENAFRPDPDYEAYWKMVVDIQNYKHGLISIDEKGEFTNSLTENYFLGYSPISFKARLDGQPLVFGGIAYMDISRMSSAAQFRHIDIMFITSIITMLLIVGIILYISKRITKPIHLLADQVSQMQDIGSLKELPNDGHGDKETLSLRMAINDLIKTIAVQVEEINLKDRKLRSAGQREKVRLEDEIGNYQDTGKLAHSDMIGSSPALEKLRNEIQKAASVDADVLVTGETGTGKQLAAEAIHRNSSRRELPFITINCGALDENLLLDALFGHVKGAFSDAKADRKGAFLAANGGTLFLDEIGNASPKVQQAVLRSLSVRKIKPLGSDQEQDFDLRLVAATNEDLKSLIEKGIFREDLYYRLKVISISTPPLRDRKDDIPILADCFLKEAALRMNKKDIGLSRGALERLINYNWPGNIRELKNCITRAVAMAEEEVIHTEDIRLDEYGAMPLEEENRSTTPIVAESHTPDHAPQAKSDNQKRQAEVKELSELNPRQHHAFERIVLAGEVTRSAYQAMFPDGLPSRTAQYDLQEMVRKGYLIKTGKGPATKYLVAR